MAKEDSELDKLMEKFAHTDKFSQVDVTAHLAPKKSDRPGKMSKIDLIDDFQKGVNEMMMQKQMIEHRMQQDYLKKMTDAHPYNATKSVPPHAANPYVHGIDYSPTIGDSGSIASTGTIIHKGRGVSIAHRLVMKAKEVFTQMTGIDFKLNVSRAEGVTSKGEPTRTVYLVFEKDNKEQIIAKETNQVGDSTLIQYHTFEQLEEKLMMQVFMDGFTNMVKRALGVDDIQTI